MRNMDEGIISNQIAYYRARADEYDEWFLRKGRYDRGTAHRDQWFAEIEQVRSALKNSIFDDEVLELACGTGLWTALLARTNRTITAVDASPEAIAISQARTSGMNVSYVAADIFSWTPPRAFDAVFFAFWLSHVPEERFDAFWDLVKRALKPDGKVFFVDSLFEQSSTAVDHDPLDRSDVVKRRLNDGREFHIVKVFHEPKKLETRLRSSGWEGTIESTGKFFLYGSASRGQQGAC